jgi:hypothetical protein
MTMVREAVKKTGKDVGILLDTKGAEIRTTVQDTTEADLWSCRIYSIQRWRSNTYFNGPRTQRLKRKNRSDLSWII